MAHNTPSRVKPALAAPLLIAASLWMGCAGGRMGSELGSRMPIWSQFRSAGIRVTASAPKASIERNWLERMFVLELKQAGLFGAVYPLGDAPGRSKADLEIIADITRVQRHRYLKLQVTMVFREGSGGSTVAEKRWMTKTSIRPQGLRKHHKAAGQAGIRIARKAIAFIQERRRREGPGSAPLRRRRGGRSPNRRQRP